MSRAPINDRQDVYHGRSTGRVEESEKGKFPWESGVHIMDKAPVKQHALTVSERVFAMVTTCAQYVEVVTQGTISR